MRIPPVGCIWTKDIPETSKLTSLGVITMESNKEPKDRETAAGSKLGRVAKDFFLGCIAFIPLAVFVFIFYYLILLFKALGRMIFGLTESV